MNTAENEPKHEKPQDAERVAHWEKMSVEVLIKLLIEKAKLLGLLNAGLEDTLDERLVCARDMHEIKYVLIQRFEDVPHAT